MNPKLFQARPTTISFTIDERGRVPRMRMGANERVRAPDAPTVPAP